MKLPSLSSAVLSAVICCSFFACAKVQDMHDATMSMSGTTSKMSSVTSNMNGVMTEIFDAGRQGAALDLRSKHWDLLMKSPKLEDKGTYAGLYFLAFEFQLWSNLGQDAQLGERDRLMKDAVDEFFRRLTGIAHWTAEELDPFAGKNPLNFGEVENEKSSFNALAGSIERNNRKQEFAAASSNSEALSMLKLVENALRAGKEIREGRAKLSDFPEYVDIVLQREELATRLLKARYQVMGLAVLGYLTPMTRNMVEGFKYKIWGKNWDLDLNQLNQSQVRLASYRLGEALAARETLAELGIEVSLDPSIKKIFANAHVKNAPGQERSHEKNIGSESARAQIDLLAQIQKYTGEELR